MNTLPDIALLPPASEGKRVCVAISDIHCTDCTVGNQTGEAEDWQRLFAEITAQCHDASELVLLLNGDIADLIRTDLWHRAGVYPWQRDHPQFPLLAGQIMDGIIARHATPGGFYPDIRGHGGDGFFVQMRACLGALVARGIAVRVIPVVGNHDKELMAVPEARRRFYRDCLGWPDGEPDAAYRDWIAAMYGPQAAGEPVQLPFYFGDNGFALFATHGQWRDDENSRSTAGWACADGWQPARWQQQGYAPFTGSCFGDTVASGLLSGFIADAKDALDRLDAQADALNARAVNRFNTILDELDLYRPAVAGLMRILQEARRQRSAGVDEQIITIITHHLHQSLKRWLAFDFLREAAPAVWRWRNIPLLKLLTRFELEPVLLYAMPTIMQWMSQRQTSPSRVAVKTLLRMPTFADAYRAAGFRLHVEGHTHVALEAELQFDQPAADPNYSYVNLGAWRSQVVERDYPAERFRRRGIGRALFIIDEAHGASRRHNYFALDLLRWGGHHDRMNG
jgi:UDP-2,3-diacylglucosamine pyrophosphatase LpxH